MEDTPYEPGKTVGEGSFGKVFLATNTLTKREVAIKQISKKRMHSHPVYETLLKQELEILEVTDHPNIVRVIEILEGKKNYFVVMECVRGGNLLEKLEANQEYSEATIVQILHQIMLALNHMHK